MFIIIMLHTYVGKLRKDKLRFYYYHDTTLMALAAIYAKCAPGSLHPDSLLRRTLYNLAEKWFSDRETPEPWYVHIQL